jgi:hypothetical protein
MDGILGRELLHADLGVSPGKKNAGPQPKVVVRKSLSDLLNGNLGDILSSYTPPASGGDDENDGLGAIIRFQWVEYDKDMDQETEAEYYEDEDDAFQ